jgi:hypothetical protein
MICNWIFRLTVIDSIFLFDWRLFMDSRSGSLKAIIHRIKKGIRFL